MKQQRSNDYIFHFKKDLVSFFSNYLLKDEIEKIYSQEELIFKRRDNSSRGLNKIQLLKKVEYALSRHIKQC